MTPSTTATGPAEIDDLRDRSRAKAQAWELLTGIDGRSESARLEELFAQGRVPEALDGDHEGQVLGLFGSPFLGLVDRLVRAGRVLGGIGWTGKSFDAETGTGYNRLTSTSRIPMFLAMPRYGFTRRHGELTGFRFDHRVEPSPLDPDRQVHAVIYDNPAHDNPMVLPRTRDELVEIVPEVYLGRALLDGDDGWEVVAYFALRRPVGG